MLLLQKKFWEFMVKGLVLGVFFISFLLLVYFYVVFLLYVGLVFMILEVVVFCFLFVFELEVVNCENGLVGECQLWCNIVFLKMYKMVSSILLNILFCFGQKYWFKFVFFNGCNDFDYLIFFVCSLVQDYCFGVCFNIICNYMCFYYDEVCGLVLFNVIFIIVFCDFVCLFEFFFYYFGLVVFFMWKFLGGDKLVEFL